MKVSTYRRDAIRRGRDDVERIGAMETLSNLCDFSDDTLAGNGIAKKKDPTIQACDALAPVRDAGYFELDPFAQAELTRGFRPISHAERVVRNESELRV